MDYANLLKPVEVGALTARNRFMINAMECNDADEPPSDGGQLVPLVTKRTSSDNRAGRRSV